MLQKKLNSGLRRNDDGKVVLAPVTASSEFFTELFEKPEIPLGALPLLSGCQLNSGLRRNDDWGSVYEPW